MVEDMLFGWMVGPVMYLLLMARDTYNVCYVPDRTESCAERSRHEG
jgi:hypothetical protein